MRKRILVIDDDKYIGETFKKVLEDENYDVDACDSGVEGIERLKDNGYDLIFLDLDMPVIDGIQTLREIRKIDRTVAVLILTGFHEKFLNELQALLRDGYSFELMRKPLGGRQLIQVANDYLNHNSVTRT